jgi:hypothetical protein
LVLFLALSGGLLLLEEYLQVVIRNIPQPNVGRHEDSLGASAWLFNLVRPF